MVVHLKPWPELRERHAAHRRVRDAEWKEAEHKRGGNPSNTGQFSKGGGKTAKKTKADEWEPPAPFEREGGLDPLKSARESLEAFFSKYRQHRMTTWQKTDPSAEDYSEQVERYNRELEPVNKAARQEMVDTVGKAMGVDPKRVFFSDEKPTATVGDKQFNVGGTAFHASGRIQLYGVDVPYMSTAGLLTHEMMHVKFEAIRQKRHKQYNDWIEASKKEDPDDPLMTRAGYLTEKAKKQYPLLADWDETVNKSGQWQKFVEDDGITDYSREWWQAFKDKKADGNQATHETLAEMAKLDLEGSLDRLVWFKQSETFRPLYELVNKHYKASEDDRVAT
jgi:hypothetical protein